MEKNPRNPSSSGAPFLKNSAAAGFSGPRLGVPIQLGWLNRLLGRLGIGAIAFYEGPAFGKLKRRALWGGLLVLLLFLFFRYVIDVRVAWRQRADSGAAPTEQAARPEANQGSILPFSQGAQESKGVLDKLRGLPKERRREFIRRFAPIAQGESEKYGIPASIILGSAMVHSLAGTTEVARKGKNIFAITCALNPLKEDVVGQMQEGGHCFTVYANAWTSFRAHSLLLGQTGFSHIPKRAGKDPERWAEELSRSGYTAVPDFKTLLLQVIQDHELRKYDR